MVKREKIEGKLTLQSVKLPGYSEDVKMRDPLHGEEILGVHVAMNGKDKKEYDERLIKVKELASNIKDNSLDRHDAHIIYRERWVNSIGYCLRVTQFSKTQCEGLMKPFCAAILPKMGFNRHIPLAVRYGPPRYNGKGLVHLGTHQHAKHLEELIVALRL